MAQFNDFMTQLDLSALNEYIAAHGKTVFYPILQEAYHRYLDCLVKTPAERYHALTTRYPGIIQNIPV